MNVAFATLGCKVNHYETEAMRDLFLAAGWSVVPFTESADVYVVNTCTVTATGDGKSRQLISRAHRNHPDALVAAVGCYAQADAATVGKLPGVGLVIGTDGRREIVPRVVEALAARDAAPRSLVSDIQSVRAFEPLDAVRDGRTRATLKIQDGCANYCAYCIIPYARGPIRSRPLADVEAQLMRFAAEGYREVVLTGIHLASYGRDLGCCDLLDALALTTRLGGIERVRLGSLEPKFADERFAKAAADNKKLCRQFHLSLQSGSDTVLARMRRRYTAAEYARAVELLRAAMPDCAITTDVITGFPGETEEEHRASLSFAENMRFSRMHVFPFSARPGTVAADMAGQLQKSVKEARAKEFIALGKRMTDAFLHAQIGTVQDVLVEEAGCGYTGNYVRVRTAGNPGDLVRVRITDIQKETAIGKELTTT